MTPVRRPSSVAVTPDTATLPLPSDTSALEAPKSPVVMVLTAPAMLAARLVSTAAALALTTSMLASSLVKVTKSLAAVTVAATLESN